MRDIPRADAGLIEDPPGSPPQGQVARQWYDFFRGLAEPFSSTEQTISNGSTATLSHGIGVIPRQVWAVLKNVSGSAKLGIANGREVAAPLYEDASDYGIGLSWDATSLYATVGANGIRIMREDAPIGELAAITNSDWRLIVRAR